MAKKRAAAHTTPAAGRCTGCCPPLAGDRAAEQVPESEACPCLLGYLSASTPAFLLVLFWALGTEGRARPLPSCQVPKGLLKHSCKGSGKAHLRCVTKTKNPNFSCSAITCGLIKPYHQPGRNWRSLLSPEPSPPRHRGRRTRLPEHKSRGGW